MPRQRARRSIDLGSLSAAVSRPGIDPRTWVTLAEVIEAGFDAENGFFADVVYIPSDEEQTCLVGAQYAGEHYGLWTPLEPGDIVVVAVPNGDSNAGPVIISRVWQVTAPPPPEGGTGTEPTLDVILRVKPGRKLRIHTSETGGDVEIVPDAASGRVRLGSTDAERQAARVDDFVTVGRFVTFRDDQRDRLYWLPPGAGDGQWIGIPVIGYAPVLASEGIDLDSARITTGSEKVRIEG